MAYIDIVLMVLVGAFALFGLFYGLFRTLGSIIGTIVAIMFADRLMGPAFHTFGFIFGGGAIAQVILFVIVFFLVSRVVGILLWLIGKGLGILSWIPFAKSIDRLLGGLFGFIEGVVIVGIGLFFASHVLPSTMLTPMIETSKVAKYLVDTVAMLQGFLPIAAKNVIDAALKSASIVIPK